MTDNNIRRRRRRRWRTAVLPLLLLFLSSIFAATRNGADGFVVAVPSAATTRPSTSTAGGAGRPAFLIPMWGEGDKFRATTTPVMSQKGPLSLLWPFGGLLSSVKVSAAQQRASEKQAPAARATSADAPFGRALSVSLLVLAVSASAWVSPVSAAAVPVEPPTAPSTLRFFPLSPLPLPLPLPLPTFTPFDATPTAVLAAASATSGPPSSEWQDSIMGSLQAPTVDRPQIPFPTVESLRPDPQQQRQNGPQRGKNQPQRQQFNMERQNQIIQALVSVPALSTSSTSTRPPGSDLLVLKVWTADPSSSSQASSQAQAKSQAPSVLLGGARIPLAALPSGFPTRVSLGPENASGVDGGGVGVAHQRAELLWNRYTATSDLYLQGVLCRATPVLEAEAEESPKAERSRSSAGLPAASLCPVEYGGGVRMQGVALSKFIVLPAAAAADAATTTTTTTASAAASSTEAMPEADAVVVVGIRAPATLLLEPPP